MVKNLLNLFFPKICLGCDNPLEDNEKHVCTSCRHDLPLTNFKKFDQNEVTNRLYGRVQIAYGTSLVWFSKKGIVQHLLHNLKYKGHEEVGEFLGRWLGHEMAQHQEFKAIEVVIPVPLHSKRLRQRGYNQVHKFGNEIANALNIPYNNHILQKTKSTKTQVFKERIKRWNDDATVFSLSDDVYLKNKHILLVDDIITTGATVEACANALMKIEGITLSVATMAIAE